ncbi:MAG TPA: hypothetical protein VIF14_12140 [Alphaproteobacteria bacterium]|jgi:hypothetical protein
MRFAHHKARQKLGKAFHTLAIAPEEVRFRVARAYVVLLHLKLDDFPSHLRPDFKWIMAELEKREPYQSGDGYWTIRRLKNPKGIEIAKRIADLYYRLDDLARHAIRFSPVTGLPEA